MEKLRNVFTELWRRPVVFTAQTIGIFLEWKKQGKELNIPLKVAGFPQEAAGTLRLSEAEGRKLAQEILMLLEPGKAMSPKICILMNEGRIKDLWATVPNILVAEVNYDKPYIDKEDLTQITYDQANGPRITEQASLYDWGTADYKPLSAGQIYDQVAAWHQKRMEPIVKKFKKGITG